MLDGNRRRGNRSGHLGNRRGRSGPIRQPVYGALDLGSNNCRLLIALPRRHGFQVIDAFSRIVRLGEGLAASGELSESAMERTIEALKVCRSKMRRRHVSRMRGIATAACRQAANCEEFFARAEAEADIVLGLASAEEEARLAVASCAPLIDPTVPNALVFDIGGGSTEIMWAGVEDDGETTVKAWMSLPCGVITMAERFGGDDVPRETYEAMIDYARGLLEPFERDHKLRDKLDDGALQLIGTSGTVTTIAGVYLGLERYDRRQVDGIRLSLEDFGRISDDLAAMSLEERRAQPCIGHERADMVVAGCAILEAIRRIWPFQSLRVADRGLREGMLLGMMRSDGLMGGNGGS